MNLRTRVLWSERAEFPIGWGIKQHSHEYYHMFYILQGEGIFMINKKNTVLLLVYVLLFQLVFHMD